MAWYAQKHVYRGRLRLFADRMPGTPMPERSSQVNNQSLPMGESKFPNDRHTAVRGSYSLFCRSTLMSKVSRANKTAAMQNPAKSCEPMASSSLRLKRQPSCRVAEIFPERGRGAQWHERLSVQWNGMATAEWHRDIAPFWPAGVHQCGRPRKMRADWALNGGRETLAEYWGYS